MTYDILSKLHTDKGLVEAAKTAAKRRLSADDLLEQRVSFVYGSFTSKGDGVTKDQVRQVIRAQQGDPAER